LQIRVDNPQKHLSTLETYITFRITSKVGHYMYILLPVPGLFSAIFYKINIYIFVQTSRTEFEETEYVVRRRFNDFLWIREKLIQCYPSNLIPVSNRQSFNIEYIYLRITCSLYLKNTA
jgi:sorting nexin-7/30